MAQISQNLWSGLLHQIRTNSTDKLGERCSSRKCIFRVNICLVSDKRKKKKNTVIIIIIIIIIMVKKIPVEK